MLNKYYLCTAFNLCRAASRTFLTQSLSFFSKLVTTVWFFFLRKKRHTEETACFLSNYELQV